MACNQTLSGIVRDCQPNIGGIVEVYLANASDVSGVTITENKVTAITMAASAKFKKYTFNRNTGSMTSTYTIDPANGTRFVTTDLVLQFSRMETTKRVEIVALAAADVVAIVKDANGVFHYLGYDEPLTASAGTGETGTARADRNGYAITLQDNSAELPYEVLVGTGGVDLDTIVG
jgi:hypothetical protein